MHRKACHSHPAEDDRNRPAVDDHNHPAEDDRNRPAEDDRSHPAEDDHNHPGAADRSHLRRCSCYVDDSHPVGAVEHCSAEQHQNPLDGNRPHHHYCDSLYAHRLGVQLCECVDVVNDLDDTLSERHPVQSLPVSSRCFRNPCVV